MMDSWWHIYHFNVSCFAFVHLKLKHFFKSDCLIVLYISRLYCIVTQREILHFFLWIYTFISNLYELTVNRFALQKPNHSFMYFFTRSTMHNKNERFQFSFLNMKQCLHRPKYDIAHKGFEFL